MNSPAPADAPGQARQTQASAVEVRNAVKHYGTLKAVDVAHLNIPRGGCYALLGPNGAGKSTLIKMISAQMPPDSGSLSVLGSIPWENQTAVKARLGIVLQDDVFDDDLDIIGNLRIYALFFWRRGPELEARIATLLKFMGLDGREKTPVLSLSGGMRRRLMIARALLNNPELLILDEPTTGLDPQVRHAIWAALRKLKAAGMTILLTTHYMEEASQLADTVGIMNKGQLIAEDAPASLIASHVPRAALEFDALERPTLADEAAKAVAGRAGVVLERHGDRIFVYSPEEEFLADLVKDLNLTGALVRRATLEDVFLKLTGRALNE